MSYTRSAYLGACRTVEQLVCIKTQLAEGAKEANVNFYVHEDEKPCEYIVHGLFKDRIISAAIRELTVDVWGDNHGEVDDYIDYFCELVRRRSIHPLKSYRERIARWQAAQLTA